ncbi:hypothetical protein ACFYU5_19085 [Nocardia aobensis]|uniref:Uncharacterized protein n=1 Tax=Nocardia aobensis TaxID=257277 RepID=A0ABW6P5T5_9NOCA
MTTLWVVLTIVSAVVLVGLTIAAADGVWTFIKLALINTALWFVIFMLTVLLIGMFPTGGAIASCVIYALLLLAVYKLSKAIALYGRARKHPEDYIVLDKVCGECGRAIMADPFGLEDATHIYKPDTPHKVTVVDGRPDLLDKLDVSHRLVEQ